MAISLKATIGLITTPFTAGVKRLAGGVKAIGSKIRGMVSGAVGKFALLAGATGLGMLIRKTVALGSEMSDLADRTHTTVERFGALREVARDAGVEASILERGLRNIGLRAQAAADGNQSYAKAMKRLGIEMKGFLNLDAGLKFEQIAIAVDKAENKSEAFRDAATLLGERAGPMLTEVLREVAERGLDPLADALLATGQIMSNQTAKSLDTLEDMFQRFKDQMIIVTGNMLNAFIPANGKAQDAMNNLVDKGVVILAQALGTVVLALKQAVDFITFLVESGESLIKVVGDLGPAFNELMKAAKVLNEKGLMGIGDAAKHFEKFGFEAQLAWDKHGEGVRKAGIKFGKATKENATQFQDLLNKQGKFAFLAKLGQNQVAEVGKKAVVLNQAMGGANAAAAAIAGNMAQAQQNVAFMQRRLARLKKALDDANAGAKAMAGFFGDADKALVNILKNENIRAKEVKRIEEMRKAAQKAQQKMNDLTKEGFNALVREKQQLAAMVLEWLKIHQPQKIANMNQAELNKHILGTIKHMPQLNARFQDVSERIDEAANALKDVNQLQDLAAAKVAVQRDHWGELMNELHGVNGAQKNLLIMQGQLAQVKLDEAMLGGVQEKIDEAKAGLEEVKNKQAEFNAEAAKHPLIDPGPVFNTKAADFRVFKEQKTLLAEINDKLGGFFVNL